MCARACASTALRCITEVRSSQAQLGRFLKGGLLPADSEASSKIGGVFFLFRKGCNRLQPESFDVQFERLFPFAQVKHKKQGPLCRQSVIFEIPPEWTEVKRFLSKLN